MRKTQWGLKGGVNLVCRKEFNLASAVHKALQNLASNYTHTHFLHNLVTQLREYVGSTGSQTDIHTSLCVTSAVVLGNIFGKTGFSLIFCNKSVSNDVNKLKQRASFPVRSPFKKN